jgi:hypothetical protein
MHEIKGALEELSAAFQAAGQAVYAAQSTPSSPPGDSGGAKPEEGKKEDVADADYEIVDEKREK